MGLPRGTRTAIVALLGTACIVPASASGATSTATIGSSLQNPYSGAFLTGSGVGTQTAHASGPPLTSPVNGRITSWAVRSGDDNSGLYAIRVLRPVSGLTFTGAGTSAATSSVPPGTTDATFTFAASLPIKQNDAIGLNVGAPASGLPAFNGGGAANVLAISASFADGANSTFSTVGGSNYELLLQATVTYCTVPNVKKKKAKRAKRLIRDAGCTPKVKKKRSSKRIGRVKKQKVPPGTTRDPQEPVKIIVNKPA